MGQLSGLPSPAKSNRNPPSTAASSPLGLTTDRNYRERKKIIRARRELEKCYRSSLSVGGSGELLYLPAAAILPLRSYHGPNSLHASPASIPPLDFVATAATAADSRANIVPALPPKPNSGAPRCQHPPISVKHLCRCRKRCRVCGPINIVDALSASHTICSIGLDCELPCPVKLGDCNESQRFVNSSFIIIGVEMHKL
jgi:hypothetical protein